MTKIRDFFKKMPVLTEEQRKIAFFSEIKGKPDALQAKLTGLPNDTLVRCKVGQGNKDVFLYQARQKTFKTPQTAKTKTHTEKMRTVLNGVIESSGKSIKGVKRGGVFVSEIKEFLGDQTTDYAALWFFKALFEKENIGDLKEICNGGAVTQQFQQKLVESIKAQAIDYFKQTDQSINDGVVQERFFNIVDDLLLRDKQALLCRFNKKLEKSHAIENQEEAFNKLLEALSKADKLFRKDPQGQDVVWKQFGENNTGSFGEVRFYENENGQKIAVKLVKEGKKDTSAVTKEFKKEFQIAETLEKKGAQNCAQVLFSLTLEDGRFGYAMPYYPNGNVYDKIAKISADLEKGKINDRQAFLARLLLSRDMAQGLFEMHDAGFIHHDFKPPNCFIDAKGYARVGDFGSSFEGQNMDLREVLKIESPRWLSPEYIVAKGHARKDWNQQNTRDEGDCQVTSSHDLWALGVSIFELFHQDLPQKTYKQTINIEKVDNGQIQIKKTTGGFQSIRNLDFEDFSAEFKNQKSISFNWTGGNALIGPKMVEKLENNEVTQFSKTDTLNPLSGFMIQHEALILAYKESQSSIPAIGEGGFFTEKSTGSITLNALINGLLCVDPAQRPALDNVLEGINYILGTREYTEQEVKAARAYLAGKKEGGNESGSMVILPEESSEDFGQSQRLRREGSRVQFEPPEDKDSQPIERDELGYLILN